MADACLGYVMEEPFRILYTEAVQFIAASESGSVS